ncbi:MAG TPA: hypothetical protein VJL10_05085 [Anaerolineales bacterium]|nr:hypothetical protein [Anaerolineales bacterium]
MSIPTSYTESTLATFMHAALGDVAVVLGYANPATYAETINDTLLAYGTDDISTISGQAGILKLRTLAKVFAWQKAVGDLSTRFHFSADGGNYDRQQMFENAKKTLDSLEIAAMAYDPAYSVVITKSRYKNDPYTYVPLDERTK